MSQIKEQEQMVGEGRVYPTKRSRKYARALFLSLSTDGLSTGEYQELNEQLQQLSLSFNSQDSESNTVMDFFANPAIVLEEKKKTLQQVFSDLSLDTKLQNLLMILLDNSSLGLLSEVSVAFDNLYQEHIKSLNLSIVTAHELGSEEKEVIQNHLSSDFGKELKVTWESDPEILGGFLVKSGDQLLDSSLRRSLENIRVSLIN